MVRGQDLWPSLLSCLSLCSSVFGKVKEEEERLLSPRKAFEEQQHFEEDVCTQSRELRRSKQVGFSLRRARVSVF